MIFVIICEDGKLASSFLHVVTRGGHDRHFQGRCTRSLSFCTDNFHKHLTTCFTASKIHVFVVEIGIIIDD